MTDLYIEVENLVADIRNGLTPFWTATSIVERQVSTNKLDKMLHSAAKNAEHQKPRILHALDEILRLVKAESDKENAERTITATEEYKGFM